MNILFVVIAISFLFLFIGLPVWGLFWLRKKQHPFAAIIPIVLLIVSLSSMSLFSDYGITEIYIFLKSLSFYIVIVGMILFSSFLVWMIIGKIFNISHKKIFWLIIISTLAYSGYARINGERVIVKNLDLVAENISLISSAIGDFYC